MNIRHWAFASMTVMISVLGTGCVVSPDEEVDAEDEMNEPEAQEGDGSEAEEDATDKDVAPPLETQGDGICRLIICNELP